MSYCNKVYLIGLYSSNQEVDGYDKAFLINQLEISNFINKIILKINFIQNFNCQI